MAKVYLLVVPYGGERPWWDWVPLYTPAEAYVRAVYLLEGNGGVQTWELAADGGAFREVWARSELPGAPTAEELYRASVYAGPTGPYAATYVVEVEDDRAGSAN